MHEVFLNFHIFTLHAVKLGYSLKEQNLTCNHREHREMAHFFPVIFIT